MAAQQFNLRWNNHTVNMLQILADNFEKESLVDVTISCQGKFIKAHKIVLGACSPYLQDIFDQHEVPHPVIIMNGMKYDDIRAIVEFMYKGEVKITESDLESLLATAEGLQVKGLSNVRATRPSPNQQMQNSHSTSSTTTQGKSQEIGFGKNPTPVSSDLSNSRTTDGIGAEKNQVNSNQSNTTTSFQTMASLISSTLPHNSIPSRTQSTSSASASSHMSNNSDVESSGGTPVHLRRKRAKLSTNKDVNQNSCREREPKSRRKGNAATETVSTAVEDENSDDLPMTIKIDPPYIRDIDEDEDSDGGPRDVALETCDGHQDVKAIMSKNSLKMSGYAAAGLTEPKEKIPRPPNAFMIFANEWRRKLAIQHTNESNKEISVRLGIMWKNLPSQKKEEYFAASRQANDDHKKKYPDYYYSPKEARMRKRWKLQQQQVNQMISAGQYNPVHLVKVYMEETEASNRSGPKHSSTQSNATLQLKEK